MKKNSKQTREAVETIGIDLGDWMSEYCILDVDGNAVERGRFRNQESSIRTTSVKRGRVWLSKQVRSRPGSAGSWRS
jgi:hypothetical protein